MAMTSLPDLALSQLSELIAARMGWHFPPDRWHDLERGMRAAAHDLGFSDLHSCLEWLHSAPLTQQHIAVLADHFTVGETYFFREHRALEVLTTQILPPLLQGQHSGARPIRIWSAACCTGEEPYSIAITLATNFPQLSDGDVSIIGTDINPRFLQRATSGVYTEWSFRSTPPWVKTRYFQPTEGGRFALRPEIKRQVTFLSLNLADEVFPAPLNTAATVDVIFCRNVFIYFSPERAQTVIRNFYHLLADGGWLIVSPSETPYLAQSAFTSVLLPGIIVHRKCAPSSGLIDGSGVSALPSPHGRLTSSRGQQIAKLPSSIEPLSPEPPTRDQRPEAISRPSTLTPPVQSPPQLSRPAATFAEAKILYEQGRYTEVSEKLRSVPTPQDQASAPFSQDEAILLIRACANQGALDEAIAWCHKAIAVDVLNPHFYYLLATVLLEQGKEDDAILALRQTLYLDSKFVLAHFTLGNIFLRQKKTKPARRHFQNALVLLRQCEPATILPESEGLTAGRLSDLIGTMLPQ